MAIAVERIVANPNFEKVLPLPPVEPNAESAGIILRQRIKRFIGPFRDRSYPYASLFYIGEEPEGQISKDEHSDEYSLDRAALQTVGLEVLAEFGFDERVTDETKHSLTPLPNGVISETTVYPSTTVPHLRFKRRLDYKGGSKEPLLVDWEGYYHPPAFELHLPSFLKGKEKPRE